MAMTSLKKPIKRVLRDEMVDKPIEVTEEDRYPWGTRIDLDSDSLEMLGIDADDFNVDEQIKIRAKAKITSTSKREYVDHEGNTKYDQNICLQITHLELEPANSKSVRELLQMIK